MKKCCVQKWIQCQSMAPVLLAMGSQCGGWFKAWTSDCGAYNNSGVAQKTITIGDVFHALKFCREWAAGGDGSNGHKWFGVGLK